MGLYRGFRLYEESIFRSPLPLWEKARERGKVGKERMLAQAKTALSRIVSGVVV